MTMKPQDSQQLQAQGKRPSAFELITQVHERLAETATDPVEKAYRRALVAKARSLNL